MKDDPHNFSPTESGLATRVDPLSAELKRVFGYDTFRPLQREIMDASLAGRDVVAILPTGAGKSLCYQLPALVRAGLTVVASPLIALMKDQVDQMQAAGVAATFINSTLDSAELRARMKRLDEGAFRILYVAPERLVSSEFLTQLRRWRVEAIAVDEAHCISEWGHDFRPEYRQIASVRALLPDAPIIALTATATERVRADIAAQLRLRDPEVFVASFDRPNLNYRVVAKGVGSDKPAAQLLALVESRPNDSGIVYCQSRKGAESMATALRHAGHAARPYHAGLDAAERARNQDAFLRDETRIVCATIAFGMGINKPNVRFVVHADLPKNIEGYYQETGRAGRDGLPAECLLLYSRGDVAKHLHFLNEISDLDARAVSRAQLDRMVSFAESAQCRRVALLGYFGEQYGVTCDAAPDTGCGAEPTGCGAEPTGCGACDNCLTPRELEDVTTDAQKLLSCVIRVQQKSGFNVGLQHIAEVLCGANTEKIRRWNHESLSTYGLGRDRARPAWISLGRQLLQEGLLDLGADGLAVVHVTERGADALRNRNAIVVPKAITPAAMDPSLSRKANRTDTIECDDELFEHLRTLRKQVADERNVPPYVIFSDVSLRFMARGYPATRAHFLAIPGIGEKRFNDFGAVFSAAIEAWTRVHGTKTFASKSPQSPAKNEDRATLRPKPASSPSLSATVRETLRIFREGHGVDDTGVIRGLAVSTIESHLALAAESGEYLDPREFFTDPEEAEIAEAFAHCGSVALRPVFDHLGERVAYGKLRMFLALRHSPAANADPSHQAG